MGIPYRPFDPDAAESVEARSKEPLPDPSPPIHCAAGADWREPTPQQQGHAAPGSTMPLANDAAETK
jgi:hypothetical protein